MLIIRTYALYGQSHRIVALTVSLLVAAIVFALVNIFLKPSKATVLIQCLHSGPFYLEIAKANMSTGRMNILFPFAYILYLELCMVNLMLSPPASDAFGTYT